MGEVVVEVLNVASDMRQIGPREKLLASIDERRQQLEEAIISGVDISGEALKKVPSTPGWQVSELSVRFGVAVTAEAGAIVTRAGGEASFEVNVTITREQDQ